MRPAVLSIVHVLPVHRTRLGGGTSAPGTRGFLASAHSRLGRAEERSSFTALPEIASGQLDGHDGLRSARTDAGNRVAFPALVTWSILRGGSWNNIDLNQYQCKIIYPFTPMVKHIVSRCENQSRPMKRRNCAAHIPTRCSAGRSRAVAGTGRTRPNPATTSGSANRTAAGWRPRLRQDAAQGTRLPDRASPASPVCRHRHGGASLWAGHGAPPHSRR